MRLLLAALVLLSSAGWATTGAPQAGKCPVCQGPVAYAVLFSSNNAGGSDRDFLQRARGGQPILLEVATCPKCLYSAYAERFSGKNPPSAAVRQFVQAGKLVLPPRGPRGAVDAETDALRQGEFPAAFSYDLMAQLARVDHASDSTLLDLYLKASWAVRLEENPLEGLWEACERKKLYEACEMVRRREESDAELELRWAEALLDRFSTLDQELHPSAALAALYLLRAHGENELLKLALPRLSPSLPSDVWPALQQPLTDSLAREERYQRLALETLERVLASPEGKAREDYPQLVYLGAELHRRLGDEGPAREGYEQALKVRGLPDWLKKWVHEQQALLRWKPRLQ